ncbi:uncharacterized protein LOC126972381 isoform X2 [Leptidea sinapis]|uniref:uncharacterized protein LOC126972381 isoform X2 n=1 Tax=Leptidea sinapis TaxID=189913 RepID=UPI0021C49E4A|nr:uncharacterized protein LOC126972381 isoform X2 [Leptidea sinapis]
MPRSENEFTIGHDDEKSKYDTEKQENNETFTENCSSKEDSSGEESSDGGDDENDRTTTLKVPLERITKGLIIALLYVALNIDESEFQLSHLQRFIREGHLSLLKCRKFLPMDFDVKKIPRWKSFIHSMCINYSSYKIRTTAFSLFLRLDLGLPRVPDLRKIACNFTKELCLTNDFSELVFSLMYQFPFDFVNVSMKKKMLVLIPDYESICMAYVLVALKMCFGLDSDYEIRLSKLADKVNDMHDHPKSYKIGGYSESSNRWYCFTEWCMYLKFRRTILCKHNFTLAKHLNSAVGESVFLEHLFDNDESITNLRYELTKDILDKIPVDNNPFVIPKSEYRVSLTPMSAYSEVIVEFLQDPDLKLLLSEDFSQYSLEYVTNKSKLLDYDDTKSLITGVTGNNKFINKTIVGNFSVKRGEDGAMVFVRFCENENWLDTKPPTLRHVKIANEQIINSGESEDEDHSKSLININESNITTSDSKSSTDTDSISQTLLPEAENNKELLEKNQYEKQISFVDYSNAVIYEDDSKDHLKDITLNMTNTHETTTSPIVSENVVPENMSCDTVCNINDYNNIFDRNTIIKELLDVVCRKYKISLPRESSNGSREKKRKNPDPVNCPSGLKRQRKRLNDTVNETVAGLLSIYYHKLFDPNINPFDNAHHTSNSSRAHSSASNSFNSNVVQNDVVEENNSSVDVQKEDEVINKDNEAKNEDDQIFKNDKTALLTSDDESDDEIVKPDPKFDKEKHDVSQLYLDFNAEKTEDVTLTKLFHMDKELECILEKHLERNKKLNKIESKPVSKVRSRKLKKGENMSHIKEFKYWFRHYDINSFFIKSREQHEEFNIELDEFFPKSFVFILRECAVIADTSPFRLYKLLQYLESRLVKFAS